MGNYVIPYLVPNVYTVSAEVAGFKRFIREGVEIRVADSVTVDIVLSPGVVSESITVTGTPPLLEASSASLGQVVDRKRIEDLPLLAGNPFHLLDLSTGITPFMFSLYRDLAAPNQPFSAVGNARYANEFSIDGVPNVRGAPFEGGNIQPAFLPPASAVSEMKVHTVFYDASLGHASGASVNMSTTSGTNTLHGEVHEHFRNRALDAPTFFQNRAGQKLPVYQDNLFGGSAGGPLVIPKLYDGRNKSFWFYAYEGHRFRAPMPNTRTVPTPQQLEGDFSQLLALGARYQIYDPATIRAEAGGRFSRSPFAGNIIPANRIDPLAHALGKFWPAPNQVGTADGTNNFYSGQEKALKGHNTHITRLDHAFSESHRIFTRLHYDYFSEYKNDDFNNVANRTHHIRQNHGAALDDVIVFSPAFILNMRYGFVHFTFPESRTSRGIDLGALGFSSALVSLTDPDRVALPRIDVDGYRGFSSGPDRYISTVQHSGSGNFSSLSGNHSMRFGAEFRLDRQFNDSFIYGVSPYLSYGSTWTRGPLDNSPAAPIGQGLASFLLGIPTGNRMEKLAGGEALQSKFSALYWQDDWKISSKLTWSFGLRYEYEAPLTEKYNRSINQFDFAAQNPIYEAALANYALSPIPELPVSAFRTQGGLLFAGAAGRPRTFWDADKNNFMPRVGFAYSMNPATVIRGGYGIFFDTIGTRNWSIQSGFQQPTSIEASLNNGLSFIASTANPLPTGLLPALGPSGGLATNTGQAIRYFLRSPVNSYAQRWSLGVQRQLMGEILLDVSYVGNRGTKLPVTRDYNALPAAYLSRLPYRDNATNNFLSSQVANPFLGLLPGTGLNGTTISRSQLLRPFPHFTSIQTTENQGYSWYHSLQIRSEKRFSRGYTINLAYTWSKAMQALDFLNASDPMPERVISPDDRTHRLVLSGIYELPFGRGRSFGSGVSRFLDAFIGGWQVNAKGTRMSGGPLGFGNSIFNGDLKDIVLPRGERTVERWFNVDAGFERNSANQLVSNLRTLPSRFSGIRGDGKHMWDMSALKNFALTERVTLQFRAEAYNALNHPNFGNPSTSPTSSAFGTVSSQPDNPRWWQLTLRLKF
jgi:hypothetical protein